MNQPDDDVIAAATGALRDANNRLDAAIDVALQRATNSAFSVPSLLPGWTVGHVVTHLARNADGLRRVLAGARVGEQLPIYDSPQAREDGIQKGAQRGTQAIAVDYRDSSARLQQTIESLPPHLWSFTVDLGRGGPATADVVLAARLGEVELHHHDLGVDNGLALLDDTAAHRLLQGMVRSYIRTREVPAMTLQPTSAAPIEVAGGGPQIAGTARDLVGWLSGRGDGAALSTEGALPELPSW